MTEMQKPSAHGRALGAAFARMADRLEPLYPEILPRCKTCAYRAGTFPNQMAGTLLDALSCHGGEAVFGCHAGLKVEDGAEFGEPAPGQEPRRICSGYLLVELVPIKQFAAELAEVTREMDCQNPPICLPPPPAT